MDIDIKTRLLDAAQSLVQTRGFNGFSYRDLSGVVGIRTASIHYHFPTKSDLAVALVRRYQDQLIGFLGGLSESSKSLSDKLGAVAEFFENTLFDHKKVCVCGALAGEFPSLPAEVQDAVRRLIADCESGLLGFMEEGRQRGELATDVAPAQLARLWYAGLQGALLIARASHPAALRETVNALQVLTIRKEFR
jgi:TetR/AcrR family transcriptional repressor of nem operon